MSDTDHYYDQAVEIVIREQRASTSFIQRQLKVQYNVAANIMERMVENGIVTAPNHQGKRRILVKS